MKLIVGLGNPENKYNSTYHNIGFYSVDKIASKFHTNFSKKDCKALTAVTYIGKEKIILAKPMTYMNLSGDSVSMFKNKYKLSTRDIFIIVDDIDLEKGKYRFRENGSGGSHNGLKDIVLKLNSTDFPRLRIGIGRDENKDLADYVLSKIDKESMNKIDLAINEGLEFLLTRVRDDNK